MDFFQSQDNARRKTKFLVVYFIAAVVMIIATVYAVGLFVVAATNQDVERVPIEWWRPDVFAYAALGSLAIIGAGTFFKMLALRAGGGSVARSVGGVRVDPNTANAQERRLLNVVEEMAIASGVRVPEVYILPEQGINAFAAGYTPDDAAVSVTQGALDTLTRDELQGVIAHEFSHILNGDMRLNIRLIGLLFGILLLAIIGRGVLQSTRFMRGGSGRNKNSGGIVLAILAIGLALMIVGYVGVLFGRLIQAAVSRQREFLADASAVQFTRNPAGIEGALKKIGGYAAGSAVRSAHAAETSHLFFANAMQGSAFNLFATHPPLVDRIRAIDPSFDGKFPVVTPDARRTAVGASVTEGGVAPSGETRAAHAAIGRHGTMATPPPLRPEQFITALATLASANPARGAAVIDSIPEPLRLAAHDPGRARAVVLALLSATEDKIVLAKQIEAADAVLDNTERRAFGELVPSIAHVAESARLPLVDLALPAIRRLPAEQIESLTTTIDAFIAADGQTTLFEFALRTVIARYLHPSAQTAAQPGTQVVSYAALADEIALVLTAIAQLGDPDPAAVHRAFDAGSSQLGLIRDRLALQQASTLSAERLAQALANLERAAPAIKRNVLAALARAAAADGVIQPAELELLRAAAAAMDCPAPPLAAA